MKFSSMLMYVNDEFPTKQTFEHLLIAGRKLYRKGKFLYSVKQNFVNDRYYWMYFQFDNESLYTDVVVDTFDNHSKNNPRPKNQVELREQLFVCYDLQRQLLYLSDYSKKSIIKDYVGDMLQVSVIIKNVLKSIEDFVSAVKYLKSVTFIQRRSCFTSASDSIFQKQVNLYGLDLPEHSKLKFDYGATPVGIAKKTLQNWGARRNSKEFEDIIIVGLDDSGFESTFDFSTLISYIEIKAVRNKNYRFDPDDVQALLLAKLGG